ncbi:hypothetical protein [Actinokineospora pegani]|uniref:hypothetical protein n=1 Tax=Actinokineospora pegani TaxID=2654637 RepID=UPI0012EAD26D|nr:hypothetical protein [Actinokineospora pegani]
MLRTLLRRAGVVALATAAAASMATTPASAVAAGYYKNAYSDTIYQYEGGAYTPIDLATWEAAGFPEPQATPTSYVKYAWSPHVYAVTFWEHSDRYWQWELMDFAMWNRAGKPVPANAGWIQGSEYYKWGTSNEVFVFSDGISHKLTYDEWRASGFRTVDELSNEGFMKMSWASDIRFVRDLANYANVYIVDYDDWRREDFPTPQAVHRLPGDGFYRSCYSYTTIVYDGPILSRVINHPEWVAAGRPAPAANVCVEL